MGKMKLTLSPRMAYNSDIQVKREAHMFTVRHSAELFCDVFYCLPACVMYCMKGVSANWFSKAIFPDIHEPTVTFVNQLNAWTNTSALNTLANRSESPYTQYYSTCYCMESVEVNQI